MIEAVAQEAVDLQQMGRQAKAAAVELAQCSTAQKNEALLAIADALAAERAEILAINAEDMAAAREAGVDELYIRDRLNLERRMDSVIADVRKVAQLPDPVGERFDEREPREGLRAWKQRTSLGVLGVIYEARPQVTVDVAALALKTGNAVILRGGREVLRSNMALVRALSRAMEGVGLPAAAFQYIASSDRRLVGELLRMHEYVDMIIPRGGNGLHNFCRENSTIPVITGGIGICHLYVEPGADLDAALQVIHNSKTVSPAVCNALDTLLVQRDLAAEFLPRVVENLAAAGVEFRAEPRALACLDGDERVSPAGPEDFDTEWYALTLGLKVVDSLDEAIDHIRAHSTQHSDGILTQNMASAERFCAEVDSAAVYVNASTRFTDGSALGLGAEIAISTQKLHARGPMALTELTTYKWVVIGEGHVRL
ncbi:MAG: glutamate-5-semialdehyde dehydrogenase [Anaerolineaceae bacterium]|nr:glutamate-5-semialdehyde dehydrogenase [Anaerolineaceae bacterium]